MIENTGVYGGVLRTAIHALLEKAGLCSALPVFSR